MHGRIADHPPGIEQRKEKLGVARFEGARNRRARVPDVRRRGAGPRADAESRGEIAPHPGRSAHRTAREDRCRNEASGGGVRTRRGPAPPPRRSDGGAAKNRRWSSMSIRSAYRSAATRPADPRTVSCTSSWRAASSTVAAPAAGRLVFASTHPHRIRILPDTVTAPTPPEPGRRASARRASMIRTGDPACAVAATAHRTTRETVSARARP